MLTSTPIQTNHGVSYPVVGSKRIEQEELTNSEEPPNAADQAESHQTSSHTNDQRTAHHRNRNRIG